MDKFITKRGLIIIGSILLIIALIFGVVLFINFNGYLIINTENNHLTIDVDGEITSYQPGEKITLRAGKHEIKIKTDGSKESTQEVEIRYNKETIINIQLEPETDDSTLPELQLDNLEYN